MTLVGYAKIRLSAHSVFFEVDEEKPFEIQGEQVVILGNDSQYLDTWANQREDTEIVGTTVEPIER